VKPNLLGNFQKDRGGLKLRVKTQLGLKPHGRKTINRKFNGKKLKRL